jgi:hypothetical protein
VQGHSKGARTCRTSWFCCARASPAPAPAPDATEAGRFVLEDLREPIRQEESTNASGTKSSIHAPPSWPSFNLNTSHTAA